MTSEWRARVPRAAALCTDSLVSPRGRVTDVDPCASPRSSIVALHPKTMETLQLFRGDTVLLKVSGSSTGLVVVSPPSSPCTPPD